MTSGLIASANTYFVGLEDALGSVRAPVETAVAMGMHFDNPVTQHTPDWYIDNEIGSFTLGPDATSPLDLASAYATVAASGTQCDPIPVTGVLDQNGQPMKGADGQVIDTGDRCTPEALKPGVANTLANMMVGVVTGGTGRRAAIPGHTIAGKTGTTQDNKTAAFGGITPKYAVSVMYFDPLGKVLVGGEGGGIPATIFHDAMAPILAGQPDTPFAPSDPAVEAGTRGSGYVAAAARTHSRPGADDGPAPGRRRPRDPGNGDGGGNPGNGEGGGDPGNGGGPPDDNEAASRAGGAPPRPPGRRPPGRPRRRWRRP